MDFWSEIYKAITHTLPWALPAVFLISGIFEFTKIPVNPWSWIFKKFSNIITKDTNQKLDSLEKKIDEKFDKIVRTKSRHYEEIIDGLSTSKADIEELSKQHQMEPKVLLPESLEVLRTYDWPGNIKQLQSVLEYSFFNTSGHEIYPTDINLMGSVKPDNKWKTDKEIFLKAWKAAGGNVSRLSNLLSVSRVTLYRYIKKYGLEK